MARASIGWGLVCAGINAVLMYFGVWAQREGYTITGDDLVRALLVVVWLASLIPGVVAIRLGASALRRKTEARGAGAGIVLGFSPLLAAALAFFILVPQWMDPPPNWIVPVSCKHVGLQGVAASGTRGASEVSLTFVDFGFINHSPYTISAIRFAYHVKSVGTEVREEFTRGGAKPGAHTGGHMLATSLTADDLRAHGCRIEVVRIAMPRARFVMK